MVGPGTGVAPFRGFVRERALQKKEGKNVGPTLLFYGCRHSQQDFLYADEWPDLFDTLGDDAQLITAFSRETPEKVYVQHRLLELGDKIWDHLQLGGYVYVCGDAKNMAREVQQAFVSIAQTHGGKTEDRANAFIKSLRSSGRVSKGGKASSILQKGILTGTFVVSRRRMELNWIILVTSLFFFIIVCW
jgi:NADPH-ferrihemoprotein reductase